MKRTIATLIGLAVCTVAAFAQRGNIGFIYPAGGQRGTVVEITVGGQGLSRATGIIISGQGVSGELIPAPEGQRPKKKRRKDIGEEDNLQLADQVKFRLTIDKKAPVGMRDVRLVLPNGVTNRLYFEVGELRDVLEDAKSVLSAESQSLPVTFNGQVMRADLDRFRFKARRGQQLVISVKARTFVPYIADAVPGWFQPIIRLYGPDGVEVAYNDDYTFHVDPVLFYKVPVDGMYDIEINDALWRGRGDFVYRIDVGELPFITGISPLGGPVGVKTKLKLRGYNLKSANAVVRPSLAGKFPVSVTSRGGMTSNTVYFDASELDNVISKADNTSRATAEDIAFGEVCENVISAPMQQRWYRFFISGSRKVPCHISVRARQLGAPTDVRMTLFDESGERVKDVDDFVNEDECMTTHFADPQMTLRLSPGTYYIRVNEAQGHYGDDFGFRISLEKAVPDFSLHIEPAVFTVPENGTGVFNVLIDRKQDFRGPVDIDVSGLPKGCKVAGASIAQGQKKTMVSITAPEGTEHRVFNPKVTGTASKGGETITRKAVPVETMMQAFYYTHLMPVDEFRMEVSDQLPFRLVVDKEGKGALRLDHFGETAVKVHIERKPGFRSPVTVMMKTSGGLVKARAVVIPENESEAVLQLTVGGRHQNKRDIPIVLSFYGVVKGSSKKLAGKGRNAYSASITAYAPVIDAVIPKVL